MTLHITDKTTQALFNQILLSYRKQLLGHVYRCFRGRITQQELADAFGMHREQISQAATQTEL